MSGNEVKLPLDSPVNILDTPVDEEKVIKEEVKDVPKTEEIKEAEVKKESSEQQVEQVDIDGVIYTLKDGNAVDDKGNLVYNAEQLKQFTDKPDEEEVDYISEIVKKTNIVLTDEAGKQVKYENTVDGISNYISDVREKAISEGSNEALNKFFETYPELHDVYRHVRLNGTMEGYSSTPSYSNFKLDGDNSEQLENLIITARIAKGDTPEEAKRFLKYSKDDSLVKDDATKALSFLQNREVEVRKQQDAIIARQEADVAEEDKKYFEAINNTLQKGVLNLGDQEIVLPKVFNVKKDGKIYQRTVKDFQEYITKPIKVKIQDKVLELTQNQLDLVREKESRNHNHDLYEAIRRFLGYDDTQLIKGAIQSDKVKQIKKLVSSSSKKSTGEQTQIKGKLKLPI